MREIVLLGTSALKEIHKNLTGESAKCSAASMATLPANSIIPPHLILKLKFRETGIVRDRKTISGFVFASRKLAGHGKTSQKFIMPAP